MRLGSLALVDISVDHLVNAIGFVYFASHIDIDRVRHCFGGLSKFFDVDSLVNKLKLGVTMDIEHGAYMPATLRYVNHHSTAPHGRRLWLKLDFRCSHWSG